MRILLGIGLKQGNMPTFPVSIRSYPVSPTRDQPVESKTESRRFLADFGLLGCQSQPRPYQANSQADEQRQAFNLTCEAQLNLSRSYKKVETEGSSRDEQ